MNSGRAGSDIASSFIYILKKSSGRSSQHNRHNMLVRQLRSAKSQLLHITSDTQISFASRNHQYNNDEIFSQWTLLPARGRQYAQADPRCNASCTI